MRNASQYSVPPLAVVASTLHLEGYDFAKQFVEHGYDIIVAARNPSVIEEAQDFKEMGANAVSFQLDLTTSEGAEQLYSRIIATGRPVEAVILNYDMTELAKKILKNMTARGHGRILFAGDDFNPKNAYEIIATMAQGTGVTVGKIKAGEKDLQFLQ